MNAISYWCTYIQAVLMVLMFVRATRESDWKAHVETFRLMLPFFFSLDRQNYARLVLAKILYAKFAIIYYCDARLPFCSQKNLSPKICCHTLLLRNRPTLEFFTLSLKVVQKIYKFSSYFLLKNNRKVQS